MYLDLERLGFVTTIVHQTHVIGWRSRDLDPVHSAVLRHSLAELQDAFSKGSQVDLTDREGRTPLFYPVRDGEISIALELLNHGANVNARDKNLETPLHFAARNYQTEVAKLLIRHDADIDAQDVHGNSALWRAAFESRGRGEMIRVLLAHGADKMLQNKQGISPNKLAATIANHDVKQFFT